MQMVRTPYWSLERDVGHRFFRLRRSALHLEFVDIDKDSEALARAFRNVDTAHLSLLIDLRDSPIRNDATFEETVRPYQERIIKAFGRVAVLIRTPVGRLQVERILAPISATARVFADETAAVAFLSGD